MFLSPPPRTRGRVPPQPQQKLGEQSWEWMAQCLKVRVSGRLVEGCRDIKEDREGWKEAMIPRWRSKRAIAKLGRLLSAVKCFEVNLSHISEEENMIPIRVLTEILAQGGEQHSIQTLTLSYLRDADSNLWQGLLAPLQQYQPQSLSEICVQYSVQSEDADDALNKLVKTLPNLKRLTVGHCPGLRDDGLRARRRPRIGWLLHIASMAAFHLEDVAIVRSFMGDYVVDEMFSDIVSIAISGTIQLRTLRLEKVGMTGYCVPNLIVLLQRAPALHTLDLSINELGDTGGEQLAKYLVDNPTGPLKKLLLNRTCFGDATLALLAKSIEDNTSLIEFAVSSVELGIGSFNEFLKTISKNTSLKQLEIGPFYTRFDNLSESQFDHTGLLNNTTLTKLRVPRVPPILEKTLSFLCARNIVQDRLFTDSPHAACTVGLYPELLAHLARMEEGASIVHYLLRSRRLPLEGFFLLQKN